MYKCGIAKLCHWKEQENMIWDVGNWWGDVGKRTENWRCAIYQDEEKKFKNKRDSPLARTQSGPKSRDFLAPLNGVRVWYVVRRFSGAGKRFLVAQPWELGLGLRQLASCCL